MNKTKVLITLKGGRITDVTATNDLEVTVIDFG